MTTMDSPTAWATLGRPLRLGVIGGGPGSFIGPIHMSAAVLDRRFVIVAGVLSSDPLRAVSHGATTRILRGLLAGLDWRAMSSLDEPQGVVFRVQGAEVVKLEP